VSSLCEKNIRSVRTGTGTGISTGTGFGY
jgi:hypothetical protein